MTIANIVDSNGLNAFHDSNFRVVISNIPTLPKESMMNMYSNNVRGITLPGLNLGTLSSKWKGEEYLQPFGAVENSDLGEISLKFRLTEDGLNYFFLADWIMNTRHGVNDSVDLDDRMKNNCIESIDVILMANHMTDVATIKYNHCFINSIDGLSLDYNTNGAEVTFSVSFRCQEIEYSSLLDF